MLRDCCFHFTLRSMMQVFRHILKLCRCVCEHHICGIILILLKYYSRLQSKLQSSKKDPCMTFLSFWVFYALFSPWPCLQIYSQGHKTMGSDSWDIWDFAPFLFSPHLLWTRLPLHIRLMSFQSVTVPRSHRSVLSSRSLLWIAALERFPRASKCNRSVLSNI